LSHYHQLESRNYRSFDGTLIRYSAAGQPTGNTLILANGLGGNVVCWQHLIEHFGSSHRILCWDYRGLYDSSPAINNSYTIIDHVRDLEKLIEVEAVENPVLVGWSMGVQVSLEFERQNPGKAAGLILMNGTPGRPYRTAFNRDLDREMTFVWKHLERHWTKLRHVMKLKTFAVRRPTIHAFIKTIQRAGLAANALDKHIFAELGARWVDLDLGIYGRVFNHLAEHDSTHILDTISLPVLVVGGAADRMTPLHRSELMAHRISNAELCVIPKGTHFSPIEYPDLINLRIRRFLAQRLTRGHAPTLSLAHDASSAS
jgi:pimeloyl-ACP methyl ester carboxylesterase